jgi:hypothetical protein
MTREDLLEFPYFSDLILSGEEEAEKRSEKLGRKKEAENLLTKLLEQRFDALPAWAKKKIETAEAKTLERWTLRVLKAATLKDALK